MPSREIIEELEIDQFKELLKNIGKEKQQSGMQYCMHLK